MRKREILRETRNANGEGYIRIHGLRENTWQDPALYSTYALGSSLFKEKIALTILIGRPWVAVKRTFIPYWKKDAKA